MKHESRDALLNMVCFCHINISDKQARRIVRMICRHLGGVDVYIPKKIAATETCDVMVRAFESVLDGQGVTALENVLSRFGGATMYIPQEWGSFRSELSMDILRAKESGDTTNIQLAKKYKVTARTINELYNHGLKMRIKARKRPLFPDI
ncbi:hypothetical protein P0082_07775 [Candidatus Haliotispira prima]|uniref:Mor transcription activator domain-containing protein n=1 Tax=Candidatus Haliotispira prima TaxID=3034016 RepID=A0ABY8MHR6_9SPIO|nr:hypothetical protein P0082_07775 [Candidatus Haliotispira prima]